MVPHPYISPTTISTMIMFSRSLHELGHSIALIYSSENQPYSNHQYTSFVAEVAFQLHEELLLDYMLKKFQRSSGTYRFLNQAITNLVSDLSTFKAVCPTFEYSGRTKVENGERLFNAIPLSKLPGDLNKHKRPNEVGHLPNTANNYWAMVMHFYQLKYYVYQYATSFCCCQDDILPKINSEVQKTREKALNYYLTLLKSRWQRLFLSTQ